MHSGFCGLAGREGGKETVEERVRTGNFTKRLEGEAGGEVDEAGDESETRRKEMGKKWREKVRVGEVRKVRE